MVNIVTRPSATKFSEPRFSQAKGGGLHCSSISSTHNEKITAFERSRSRSLHNIRRIDGRLHLPQIVDKISFEICPRECCCHVVLLRVIIRVIPQQVHGMYIPVPDGGMYQTGLGFWSYTEAAAAAAVHSYRYSWHKK